MKKYLIGAVLFSATFSYAATSNFKFTGSDQKWKAPADCNSIEIKAWGAGGGSPGGPGGAGGAFASSTIKVKKGDELTIKVGGGGGVGVPGPVPPNHTGPGGWPNGGNGGQSGHHPGTGGGGGGSSAVLKGTDVVVEAGGGAGGWWCAEEKNPGHGTYPGNPGQGVQGECKTKGLQAGQSPEWGGCGGIGGAGGGYCGGIAPLGKGAPTGGTSFGEKLVAGNGKEAANNKEAPCEGKCGNGGDPKSPGLNGLVTVSCQK